MRSSTVLAGFVLLLALATLACLVSSPGDTNRLNDQAYWACVTATPVPTEVFLAGTVAPPTPVNPEEPAPTGQPIWGYTTPVPTETPYYRTGTFYESQKVYVNDIEFELRGYTLQLAPEPDLSRLYLHFSVVNRHKDGDVVPISQLIFVREVATPDGDEQVGRWTNSNHVLLAGCRDAELSHEYRSPETHQWQGATTYFFQKFMANYRSEMNRYRRLYVRELPESVVEIMSEQVLVERAAQAAWLAA